MVAFMKKILGNEYLLLVARLLVGFLFIVVGIGKIADPQLFAKEIANYRILPDILVNLTAIIVPWVEVVSGLLLIAGVRLRANAVLIGAMLIMFNIFVFSAWARGLDINCGCYSNIAKQTVGLPKILENMGLLALAAIIFIFPKKALSLENFSETNQ